MSIAEKPQVAYHNLMLMSGLGALTTNTVVAGHPAAVRIARRVEARASGCWLPLAASADSTVRIRAACCAVRACTPQLTAAGTSRMPLLRNVGSERQDSALRMPLDKQHGRATNAARRATPCPRRSKWL